MASRSLKKRTRCSVCCEAGGYTRRSFVGVRQHLFFVNTVCTLVILDNERRREETRKFDSIGKARLLGQQFDCSETSA